jgi:F0F1-type ATP synthase membrane subunit b/b'
MADEKSTGKRTLGVVEGIDSISEEARTAAAEADISAQIEALKTEISRMKESAGLIAESTGQLAVAKAESLRDDLRQTIQANPLATLAGAAFIGYLFGLRHR